MHHPIRIRSLAVALIGLSLSFLKASGQEASNVAFTQGTDTLNRAVYNISYDLVAPFDNIACQVSVKLSSGNGSFYLKQLQGDVGDLVFPGAKKTIVWSYVDELVHFSGDINLNIEVVPSVQVPSSVRRSKKLKVQLAPLFTDKSFGVKLMRVGNVIQTIEEVQAINKSFEVPVSKKIPAKKNYQIAIVDGDNIYYSNAFKVRPKIGYGWKGAAILAIPLYLVIHSYIEDNKSLPGPPSHN